MNATIHSPTATNGALGLIDSAAFLGGISRAGLYNLMNSGVIPYAKVGNRRVILRSDLEAYLLKQRQSQQAG